MSRSVWFGLVWFLFFVVSLEFFSLFVLFFVCFIFVLSGELNSTLDANKSVKILIK